MQYSNWCLIVVGTCIENTDSRSLSICGLEEAMTVFIITHECTLTIHVYIEDKFQQYAAPAPNNLTNEKYPVVRVSAPGGCCIFEYYDIQENAELQNYMTLVPKVTENMLGSVVFH